MTSNIGWELYRSFLGVMREGSLSGAARELGLTQPTVGRHVDALEQALGVTLFVRSPLGLTPTDVARGLREHAETMESTAASFARIASEASGKGAHASVQGVVRIAASEVIGVEVLPPIVAQLRRDHPALGVEMVLSNRLQDLLRREADIAVRMVRPKQEQLVARRIGSIELGLHARRDYLDRCGTPRKAGDLAAHTLIGFDRPTAFLREAIRAFPQIDRDDFAMASDSDLAQLALMRSGAGIGFCQVPLARRDDALVRLLPKAFSMSLDTWVTMHEDLRTSPRCRVTFDALVDGLMQYVGQA